MKSGLRCSPIGSGLGGSGTVGSGSVSVSPGQCLIVLEKKMKKLIRRKRAHC